VSIKEAGHLIKMTVCQNLPILSQLVQSELGLRFTVRINGMDSSIFEEHAYTHSERWGINTR
jgi:hypothetical protein